MSVKRAIPIAVAEKLLKNVGAPRSSLGAKQALKKTLETMTANIAENAITFAKHSKRQTILKSDIKLALKK